MKKLFTTFFCLLALDASAKEPVTYYRNALIFAYSQANSVYEDDNIKLEIYDERLWATNKTKKTIYLDLSQCFLFHNGASTPLFSQTGKMLGDVESSKMGVSSYKDEFFTISPKMNSSQNRTPVCWTSTGIYGYYTTSESPSGDFTEYDKRLLRIMKELLNESIGASSSGKIYFHKAALRHLKEEESINNIGVSIAYAFNKKAEEWTNVSLFTWVSDIIFAPYYVEWPENLSQDQKKGFGIKETTPAVKHVRADSPFKFDEDQQPFIVCDWEGNFNKGTFKLDDTWLSGKKIVYKSVMKFDGKDVDWGNLKYVNDKMKTKQLK